MRFEPCKIAGATLRIQTVGSKALRVWGNPSSRPAPVSYGGDALDTHRSTRGGFDIVNSLLLRCLVRVRAWREVTPILHASTLGPSQPSHQRCQYSSSTPPARASYRQVLPLTLLLGIRVFGVSVECVDSLVKQDFVVQ